MKKIPEHKNDSRIWRISGFNNLELLKGRSVDHVYSPHWHETFVIEVIEAGVNGFYCNGKTYVGCAGSIVLFNPGEVHTGYPLGPSPLIYRSMYPDAGLLSQIQTELLDRTGIPYFPAPVVEDRTLARVISNLHRELELMRDPLEAESMMARVLSQLILKYSDKKIEMKSGQNQCSSLRRTRDFLEDHFSVNISLRELSDISGLSSFHFLRAFRKSYGLTPFTYLLNVRIARAKHLLRLGKSISEVAQETGFYDQSHLNRHFKRMTGVTPGSYRAISSKNSFLLPANLSR